MMKLNEFSAEYLRHNIKIVLSNSQVIDILI